MTALFETPNLDGLSIDPSDYDRAAEVFRLLADYAQLKAQAMRFRLSGPVSRALQCERQMEAIYAAIPTWARW